MGGALNPGHYSFPFSFHLPVDADLPGSHSGRRGYIRYTIEARIKRPNQLIDDTATITVPVIDFVVIDESLLVCPCFLLIT